ncbi:RDD family protein [Actinomadura sp. NBRC 104425]|uniref:RDD family protein n=1 Tax=Actinomadura sp. NBRC 104425 TaxID=3032204 RepID=UPI002554177E|nr:RDD family protein [Actinomadura sp. NBRC 104425]
MTQPPHDPTPGGRPEDEPWRAPGESGAQPPPRQPQPGEQPPPYPGAYGGRDEVPRYGMPPSRHGPSGTPAPPAELASRWARLGAAVVDSLLLSIVMLPILLPLVNLRQMTGPSPNAPAIDRGQLAANLAYLAVAFLYYWLMHLRFGQTLGKMLLRTRVVRADTGGAISVGQAAGRSAFFSILGGLCGCVGIVDVAWILWDERKQALHDKVAGTVVVKAPPGSPNPYARR